MDCVNSTRPPACAKTITNTGIRFRRVGMGTLMGHVQFFGSPSTPTVAKPYHHPPTCSTRPIRQMLHTHWSLASWVSLSQALALSCLEPLAPTFLFLSFVLHSASALRAVFRFLDKVPTGLLSTTPQQSLVSVAAPLSQ